MFIASYIDEFNGSIERWGCRGPSRCQGQQFSPPSPFCPLPTWYLLPTCRPLHPTSMWAAHSPESALPMPGKGNRKWRPIGIILKKTLKGRKCGSNDGPPVRYGSWWAILISSLSLCVLRLTCNVKQRLWAPGAAPQHLDCYRGDMGCIANPMLRSVT